MRREGRSKLCGLAVLAACLAFAANAQATITIHVLSNRANLISGGEALTSISLPSHAKASAVSVTLNGSNVTSEFALRPNGSFEGLLTGLKLGTNVVSAKAGGASAHTSIFDH